MCATSISQDNYWQFTATLAAGAAAAAAAVVSGNGYHGYCNYTQAGDPFINHCLCRKEYISVVYTSAALLNPAQTIFHGDCFLGSLDWWLLVDAI